MLLGTPRKKSNSKFNFYDFSWIFQVLREKIHNKQLGCQKIMKIGRIVPLYSLYNPAKGHKKIRSRTPKKGLMSPEKKCQRWGRSGFGPLCYYRGEHPACPCPRRMAGRHGLLPRATPKPFLACVACFSWQMWEFRGVMFLKKNRNSLGTSCLALSSTGAT